MAITCPKCGAEYDVTLFSFDRRIRCDCGAWVDLSTGHQQTDSGRSRESTPPTIGVPPGRYRHYKGGHYMVLGVARHSETEEEFVVYRQDYGDHELWIRPKSMFLEMLEIAGRFVPRFEYLGPG